jgi:DNA primase
MGITKATIERIKSAPLSKVVEEAGGSLKKVGHEYVTHCVWHQDTNPSLTINDDKGFCFCHVCREGGDAIKYLERKDGLSFPDAVDLAASILGIQVEKENVDPVLEAKRHAARAAHKERLEKEQLKYKNNLRDSRAGRIRDILKDRGLTPEASKEFGIGYSSAGFFGGRITIPIYDHRKQLVGWTGRSTKSREEEPAKYKNSAEDDLFQKKFLVFNEARAREAGREAGSLIFVEGHLDVVSLWQHGIANVVAMQGTGAPDPATLERLARSVPNFVLCFDGDEGGKSATGKFISAAGPMARRGEVQISVVQMPQGQDPDEIVREQGTAAFYNLIASATSWLDWTIDFWAADLDKNNSAHVTEVENQLRAVIDELQSNALRTHYIDKVARALSHDEKAARTLAKGWATRSIPLTEKAWTLRTREQTKTAVERRMLRIYIHRPVHREFLAPFMANITHPALRWLSNRLQELEEHCASDLTPHSIMAVVVASEPHFLQQLRTLIRPNVTVDDSQGVLEHISGIMGEATPFATHEHDTDQPSAF